MDKINLKIYRKDPSVDEKEHYDTFEVPYVDGMVVLDAVRYVEENLDTTLAIRWNCKAAKCGSCSAEINGFPRLMCKTRIDKVGFNITVNPMGAFPLIKDLVTDVTGNWDILRKIPPFTPKELGPDQHFSMKQEDVERSKEFRQCIECFLCQDVCHVVREHYTDYFGPRHIVKAASLDMHPMDTIDRSTFLNKEGGLGYCNITKCCQEVCPEHIVITDNAIIQEKERAVDLTYDPLAMLIKGRRKKEKRVV